MKSPPSAQREMRWKRDGIMEVLVKIKSPDHRRGAGAALASQNFQ